MRQLFRLFFALFSIAGISFAAKPNPQHFRFQSVQNVARIPEDDVINVERITLRDLNIIKALDRRPDRYVLYIVPDNRERAVERSVTLFFVRHRWLGPDWNENRQFFFNLDSKTITRPIDRQSIAYRP